MFINSEKHRGVLTRSWQHLCSPFHALFLIKCVWLQHNTTFTLDSTVTEHYDLFRSLPGAQRYLFCVYVCVGGKARVQEDRELGSVEWQKLVCFCSLTHFNIICSNCLSEKSISRIPGETHLSFSFFFFNIWTQTEAARTHSIAYIIKVWWQGVGVHQITRPRISFFIVVIFSLCLNVMRWVLKQTITNGLGSCSMD